VTLCVHRRAPTVRGPCNGECVVDIPLRAKVSRAAIDVLLLSASLSLYIYIYISDCFLSICLQSCRLVCPSVPSACRSVSVLFYLSLVYFNLSSVQLPGFVTAAAQICPAMNLFLNGADCLPPPLSLALLSPRRCKAPGGHRRTSCDFLL